MGADPRFREDEIGVPGRRAKLSSRLSLANLSHAVFRKSERDWNECGEA